LWLRLPRRRHSAAKGRPDSVKPDWQAGKLNGVGGKIEPGETSKTAMAREFHEETGVLTLPLEWDVFAKMHFPKAEVTFLRYFGDAAAVAQTMTVYSADLNRPIREAIEHRLVRGIDEIPDGAIMPNLRWAIPMAFHDEGGRGLVSIDYAEHN
jgi:8-oxo-dGTP diphosphatase